jgi:hypothetical protein
MVSVAQRRIMIWVGLLSVIIAACTLTSNSDTTPVVITSTPPAGEASEPVSNSLETFTGPYPDMVSLLDGVCFEYLYTLNGKTWVWQSPDELSGFYDQVDASGLCPGLSQRGTFDFSGQVLVGVVNDTTGCDAAHRVIDVTQEGTVQTLLLEFEMIPDCGYELTQPFLIAVPRPPEGVTIRVVVVPPETR